MLALFSTYGFEVVIIILVIGIAAIVKGIGAVKDKWRQRQEFIDENVRRGQEMEAEKEAEILKQAEQESRIKLLEKNIALLTQIAEQQRDQINLLTQSDKLDIKAWIKTQHDIWVPKGWIDSQILDLLEERYDIYKKENGNSWALKLMNELRALPTIAVADKE